MEALPVFRAVGVVWFAVNCFSAMTYGGRLVSDRPSRLFSAQQETVQRSLGWDWIFTFVVAEMRASGCSVLLS